MHVQATAPLRCELEVTANENTVLDFEWDVDRVPASAAKCYAAGC